MKIVLTGTLTVLLFISYFSKAQDVDQIWLKQSKIDSIMIFEKSIGKNSNRIYMNSFLSKAVYPLINKYKIALPVIIEREQKGFLPVYAEYYYSKDDSVIRYISYDWERDKHGNFFKKQEIWDEESKKLNLYNEEYERIKSMLITLLGKPQIEDKEPQKTKSASGRGDYLSRNARWENTDYYAGLDMIFESMTYRIRMTYYWKK